MPCVVFASAAARADLAPAESLTVRQCIARAWQVAPELQATREDAAAAELDAMAAARNARPRLDLHSGVLVAPSGFYDPAITNLGEYDVKLVGTMPLRDGGAARRERLRAASASASARNALLLSRRETALRVAGLAEGIVQATARIVRREETMRWAKFVLRSVEAGARAGTRSPADVERLRLDLASVEVDLLGLGRTRDDAGRALAGLLFPDAAGTRFLEVSDTLGAVVAPGADDSTRLVTAFRASSEIASAEAEVRAARLELEAARAQGAFTLDLTADAGVAGADLTRLTPPGVPSSSGRATFADRLRRDAGGSVALDLHLPLVRPGARSAVSAREASLRASERRLEVARRAATGAALALLSRWTLAARTSTIQERATLETRAHADRLQSLYLAGATSLLELLDARHLYEDAQDRAEEARVELMLAALEAEIGR